MRALPVLFLLLVTVPLAAQTPGGGGRNQPLLGRQGPTIVAEPVALALAGFDADQDGRVTRAETAAGAARSFAAVARGGADIGYIGYAQWATRWLGDANALPSPFEVDGDRNDRITTAELAAALDAAFVRLDADRDGALTRAELLTIRATAFGDDGRRRGKRPPQGQPSGQPPRQ